MLWAGVIERHQQVSVTPTDTLVWVEDEGENSAWAALTAPPARKPTGMLMHRKGRMGGRGNSSSPLMRGPVAVSWVVTLEGDWRKPKESGRPQWLEIRHRTCSYYALELLTAKTVVLTLRSLPSEVRTMSGLCLLGVSSRSKAFQSCCFVTASPYTAPRDSFSSVAIRIPQQFPSCVYSGLQGCLTPSPGQWSH